MPQTVIIAEKPSVAADIARVIGARTKGEAAYEGDGVAVSWAIGHLLELVPPEQYDEKYKRWRLADLPILPENFLVEPDKGGKKQLTALKKLLASKDLKRVVNACDAGREGELIFREIYRWSGCKAPIDRLWLQSMTPAAIRQSLDHPRADADVRGLADAADCRTESDWLIGMNVTRALTVRLRSTRDKIVWSAGRVQTATLALLVRREREILAHEPRPYWVIEGTFDAPDPRKHTYTGTWFDPAGDGQKDRIFDPTERDAVVQRLERKPQATARETRKDVSEIAPQLFDLTTLQREANRRFGFQAKRTLQAAQALYERHKLITYPRTDSRALPEDYRGPVDKAIDFLARIPEFAGAARTLKQEGLQNQRRNFNDKEVSDHFAIIPTGEGDPSALKPEEAKVFDLVARRFLAAFHPPAVHTEVERITVAGPDHFRTRRKVLKVPGWRAVYDKEAGDAEGALPALARAEGTSVVVRGQEVEEKETRPPSRLNEAALLGLMETAGKEVDDEKLAAVLKETGGLGTPATRADIIETLVDREYITRCTALDNKKSLRVTPRGMWLIDTLERIEVPLTSAELTARWEDALRDMEHGRRARTAYMKEMRALTTDVVDRVRGFSFDRLFEGTPSLGRCPSCSGAIRETLRAFACEHGGKEGTCTFVMWKDISGRTLDRRSAEQLLLGGPTPPKAGFFSRDDREYEGVMRLNGERRVEVLTRGAVVAESEGPSEPVEVVDVAPCPFHPQWKVQRSGAGYRCEGVAQKACKLTLPLVLCKRPLSIEEVAPLLSEERKTTLLEGFISKRERPFSATLHLQDGGRLRWEFPPREAGRGAKKAAKTFPVDPKPIVACSRHAGSSIIETESAYRCEEQACPHEVPRELCGRVITRDEAGALFKAKETPVLEGFLSKANKPFSASLYLKRTGKYAFRFGERE